MNYHITILMPVFNAAKYISVALESIQSQTYNNLDVVCIDDGSTDNSYDILREYAKKDNRIKIFQHDKNKGLVYTRNQLLGKSTGEFISWLDADDWIAPNKLQRQLEFLHRNPNVGAVGTGIAYATLEGQKYKEETYPADSALQCVDPCICCATVLVRRKAVEDAGGFRDAFRNGGEDGDWLLRIADQWELTNIPDILYYYRKNPSSVSHTHRAEIRRLGVVARVAARLRRKSGICPLDSGRFGTYPEFLYDRWFLESEDLTGEEKTVAMTFPFEQEGLPLVSVLIPCFNSEKYILSCLQSLQKSHFRNFEICLFDDASSIPVEQFLGESLGNFSDFPLKIQRGNENRGPAFARNRCLEMAEGRFFCFLDSDDLIHPDRLSSQLSYLLGHHEIVGVGTAIQYVSESGEWLRSETYPENAVEEGGFCGCCATFMLDANKVHALRFDESLKTSSEDVEFLLRTQKIGALHNIPMVLYSYRLRPGSLTSSNSWQADHANFMVKLQAQKRGLSKIEDYMQFISSIDGSQTGDLLLAMYWRHYKAETGRIGFIVKALLLMPKSFLRMVARKIEVDFNQRTARLRRILRVATRWGRNVLLRIMRLSVISQFQYKVSRPKGPKNILVQVYDNWGDVEEALDYLLPDYSRKWGGVQFITTNLRWRKPDYYLILNHPGRKEITVKHDPKRILFAIGEPPTAVHKPMHRGQGEGTIVFSCDENITTEFGNERNYVLSPCMTRTWSCKKTIGELVLNSKIEKSKKLSWVTSNLSLLPGHRARMEFLERIRGLVDFDLYGRGFKEIYDKWIGVAPYEYSIAYENTVADYYFTEKLMDCLVAETIPLYYGTSNIHRFFPEKSVILIDPDDPKVAHKILDIINFDDRSVRLPALEEAKHLVLFKYNIFIRLAAHIATNKHIAGQHRQLRIDPIEINWELAK